MIIQQWQPSRSWSVARVVGVEVGAGATGASRGSSDAGGAANARAARHVRIRVVDFMLMPCCVTQDSGPMTLRYDRIYRNYRDLGQIGD